MADYKHYEEHTGLHRHDQKTQTEHQETSHYHRYAEVEILENLTSKVASIGGIDFAKHKHEDAEGRDTKEAK